MTRQMRNQGRLPQRETNAERMARVGRVGKKQCLSIARVGGTVHVEIRCTCRSDAEVKSKCDRRDGDCLRRHAVLPGQPSLIKGSRCSEREKRLLRKGGQKCLYLILLDVKEDAVCC